MVGHVLSLLCASLRADGGASLSLSSVLALSSCINMLRSATAASKEEDVDAAEQSGGQLASSVASVTVNGRKLVSCEVQCAGGSGLSGGLTGGGPLYTLVAQGGADETDAFLATFLHDVRDAMYTYLGQQTQQAAQTYMQPQQPATGAQLDDLAPVRAIEVSTTHTRQVSMPAGSNSRCRCSQACTCMVRA